MLPQVPSFPPLGGGENILGKCQFAKAFANFSLQQPLSANHLWRGKLPKGSLQTDTIANQLFHDKEKTPLAARPFSQFYRPLPLLPRIYSFTYRKMYNAYSGKEACGNITETRITITFKTYDNIHFNMGYENIHFNIYENILTFTKKTFTITFTIRKC